MHLVPYAHCTRGVGGDLNVGQPGRLLIKALLFIDAASHHVSVYGRLLFHPIIRRLQHLK